MAHPAHARRAARLGSCGKRRTPTATAARATVIAGELAYALDPVLFARRAGIPPDPWQVALLRSTGRKVILNCSRQTGKSTVTALLALHEALYRPPALVLLLSPSLRQSQELFRKTKDALAALGPEAPALAEESALRLEWANGSRVVCLPGKEATIRGFSGVSLLVVDEASRVPDELYFAIRPMLAVSGGRIILLSTPAGAAPSSRRGRTAGRPGSGSRSRPRRARASPPPGSRRS